VVRGIARFQHEHAQRVSAPHEATLPGPKS